MVIQLNGNCNCVKNTMTLTSHLRGREREAEKNGVRVCAQKRQISMKWINPAFDLDYNTILRSMHPYIVWKFYMQNGCAILNILLKLAQLHAVEKKLSRKRVSNGNRVAVIMII